MREPGSKGSIMLTDEIYSASAMKDAPGSELRYLGLLHLGVASMGQMDQNSKIRTQCVCLTLPPQMPPRLVFAASPVRRGISFRKD